MSHNKFNAVTGNTAGSQAWIVYENGRAYPDYLVRFYRSTRDPARTPYASRADAGPLRKGTPPPLRQPAPAPAPAPQVQPLSAGWGVNVDPNTGADFYVNTATGVSQWNKPVTTSNPLHVGASAGSGKWEFDDGGTWRPYEQAAQQSLESAWVMGQQRPGAPGASHVSDALPWHHICG